VHQLGGIVEAWDEVRRTVEGDGDGTGAGAGAIGERREWDLLPVGIDMYRNGL